MLCKAWLPTILANNPEFTASYASSGTGTLYEITTTKEWKIHLIFSIAATTTGSSNGGTFYIYKGSTELYNEYKDNSTFTQINYTSTNSYPAGTTIYIKCSRTFTSVTMKLKGIFAETIPENLTEDKVVIYPKELKALWELSAGTIYGNHTDNTYKWGIIIGKSTAANTGYVTLGNAVGFITVNYNGEIIKIPYYGN